MELKRFVNILRFSQQIKLVEAFMLGGLFLFADIILTVWLTRTPALPQRQRLK